MHNVIGSRNDSITLTKLFEDIEKVYVVEFDKDIKQAGLSKVEKTLLHDSIVLLETRETGKSMAENRILNGQRGGHEGDAQQKTIPKTIAYSEVVPCQFRVVCW